MTISVIIPCHNGEAYLAQTLRSVFNQTRPPEDVIVVDDGSTDGSAALAGSFGSAVRLVSGTYGSAAAARNAGMAVAQGDAIMFLDADDLLAPSALQHLSDVLAREPDAIACCPWNRLELIDGCWVAAPASCAPLRPGQDALSGWLTGWYHPPCSVLWSRTAYERAGGWDPAGLVNDDGDIMMRGLIAGNRLIGTDQGMAYYRRLPDGAVSLSGKRFTRPGTEARLFVLSRVARLLDEQGRLDPYRGALGEALDMVAAGIEGDHPDLHDRALAEAARIAGPMWRRRWRQAVARVNGARGRLGRAVDMRLRPPPPASVVPPGPSGAPVPAPKGGEPPLVSVIIPTYNRAHCLPRTLATVLSQTWQTFEVLVVDDASTDDTAGVVGALGDERIRLLRQDRNQGVAAARNRGMREAAGDYIAFLDSDDEWFPDKLARQVETLEASPPRVGLAYGGVETVFAADARQVDLPRHDGNVHRTMLSRNVLHGSASNVMIRRQVVDAVGFFDESLPAIEDYEFLLRVTRFYEVAAIPHPLCRYHDTRPQDPTAENDKRRSLNFAANMEARRLVHARYRHEMAAAGVEHLYLLDSARRHWETPVGSRLEARKLVLKALRARPTDWASYGLLLPGRLRRMIAAIVPGFRQGTAAPRSRLARDLTGMRDAE